MEHPSSASSRPPTARHWHCASCDIDIYVTETIKHVESPLHRLQTQGPLRASELAEPTNHVTGGVIDENSDSSEESGCTDTEEEEIVQEPEEEEEEEEEVSSGEDDMVHDELFHAVYHEQEDEISYEAKLLGEPRLPWICHVCCTTVTASRIKHLHSGPHIAAAALQPSKPISLAHATSWTCTLCNTKMPITHQALHLGSKRHLKLTARQNHPLLEPKTPKARQKIRTAGTVRPPANSITAQGGHSLSHPHAAKSSTSSYTAPTRTIPPPQRADTLFCHRCGELLNSVLLGAHLDRHCTQGPAKSPGWMWMPSTPKPPSPPPLPGHLFCVVCKKYFMPSTMPAHLAGRKHTKKAAAQQPPTVTGPSTAVPVVAHLSRTAVAGNMHYRAISNGRGAGQTSAVPPVVQAVEESPFITVTGDSFHCTLCARTRKLAGLAGHMASWKHRKHRNIAA